MNKFKKVLRDWLYITNDMQAIATDIHTLDNQSKEIMSKVFEIFHAVPFAAGVNSLSAKDAVRLTQAGGVQANSLTGILMGIVTAARQGESYIRVNGELSNEVRTALSRRGFEFEEQGEGDNKGTFILWT